MANLTAKELSLMDDLMSHEQNAVKKMKRYAADCSDPQLRNKCEQAAAMHQNHYNKLLNQLS